jgi:hypothetical protein
MVTSGRIVALPMALRNYPTMSVISLTAPSSQLVSSRSPSFLCSFLTSSVVIYSNLSLDAQSALFVRLNQVSPPTIGERLRALCTPRATWIGSLTDDDRRIVPLWMRQRGRGFLAIAQLAYCVAHLPAHATPTPANVEMWLAESEDLAQELKTRVAQALQAMRTITWRGQPAGRPRRSAMLAMAEFVFSGASFRAPPSLR